MMVEIAGGILLAALALSVLGLTLQGVFNKLYNHYWLRTDDTDDHKNRKRSGVSIVVDHGTGLEYLVTPKGGITPRMRVDGQQAHTI